MNLSSRLEKLKQQRQAKPVSQTKCMQARIGVRTWIVLGLGVVIVGLATLAVFEFLVWNKVPPELAGLWEVDAGPQKGGTFEFGRNGEMEVRLKSKKKQVTHKSQVSVQGRTLFMTTRDPLTRTETVNESTIRELTADTLILELERGDVLKMMRIE